MKKQLTLMAALAVLGLGNIAEAVMPLDTAVQYIKTNAPDAKVLNRTEANKEFLFFENSSHDAFKSFKMYYDANQPEKIAVCLECRDKNADLKTPDSWPKAMMFVCKDGTKVPVSINGTFHGIYGRDISGIKANIFLTKTEIYNIIKHGGAERCALVYANHKKNTHNTQFLQESATGEHNIDKFNNALKHCLKILELEKETSSLEQKQTEEDKLVAEFREAIAKQEEDHRYPIKPLAEINQMVKKAPLYMGANSGRRYGYLTLNTWKNIADKKNQLYSLKGVYTSYYWGTLNPTVGYNGLFFELQDGTKLFISTAHTIYNTGSYYSASARGTTGMLEGYIEIPPTVFYDFYKHGGIKDISTMDKNGLASLLGTKPGKVEREAKTLNSYFTHLVSAYGLDDEWYQYQKQKEERQKSNPVVYNKAWGMYYFGEYEKQNK